MSILARTIIALVTRRSGKRFEQATKDPVATQQQLLQKIISQNRDTVYGRAYKFAAIQTLEDFRQNVPVVGYEAISHYIDRVTLGETNVLTAEAPLLFAQTSGTTGDPKYIPVTPTCRKGGGMKVWMHYARLAHPQAFAGKLLTIVSPAIEGYTEGGVPFGSTSGMVVKEMPKVVQSAYAVPYDIYEISDYNAKYYTIMRLGLQEKISLVATANPSTILKLAELADHFADSLIRDVREGTLSNTITLEPEIRRVIEERLRPLPGRAQELEAARLRRNGKLLPADYWPSLALLGCWKGGTVGAYIERLRAWYAPEGKEMPPVRDMGYLASEARMSIPVSDQGAGGVLTVHLNLFEFVAADQIDADPYQEGQWNFLGVGEIEVGQEYYVFITTTCGLYRYDMNDIIEVVGQYNKTPVVEFRRKGRGMTNMTGEKLSVNQLMEAMARADAAVEAAIHHYRAEPDYNESRYIFKVEAGQLAAEHHVDLLRAIDQALGELNIEYQAKRSSGRLRAPILQVMRTGWYQRQKQQLVADGKRLFQAKTILLDAKRGYTPEPEELEAEVHLD
ncbi:MAG: GH3 auxin-responsive promoter family protein [Syntrophotaleaceae bacterium]